MAHGHFDNGGHATRMRFAGCPPMLRSRLADVVGIEHLLSFPRKADLGAAVAKRYRDDNNSLKRYPDTFRKALTNDNRMSLASFVVAEYDELPQRIRIQTLAFLNQNVAWLA